MFASNPDVAFADVLLSEQQIREGADGTSFAPGAGGWPTIRYFNKDTGVGGAPYAKKTSKSMCDELGPKEDYMVEYVLEAGKTSLCDAGTGAGCSDKEKDYAAKWSAKSAPDVAAQDVRLEGMLASSMKPEALKWLKERRAILKQLGAKAEL